MPCRVEHDPDIVLWLMIAEPGSDLAGKGHAFVEVLDGDVEMHHHLLLAGRGRPGRCRIVRVILERQSSASFGRSQHHPAVFGLFAGSGRLADYHHPAEQTFVERGKRSRVGESSTAAEIRVRGCAMVTSLPEWRLSSSV